MHGCRWKNPSAIWVVECRKLVRIIMLSYRNLALILLANSVQAEFFFFDAREGSKTDESDFLIYLHLATSQFFKCFSDFWSDLCKKHSCTSILYIENKFFKYLSFQRPDPRGTAIHWMPAGPPDGSPGQSGCGQRSQHVMWLSDITVAFEFFLARMSSLFVVLSLFVCPYFLFFQSVSSIQKPSPKSIFNGRDRIFSR